MRSVDARGATRCTSRSRSQAWRTCREVRAARRHPVARSGHTTRSGGSPPERTISRTGTRMPRGPSMCAFLEPGKACSKVSPVRVVVGADMSSSIAVRRRKAGREIPCTASLRRCEPDQVPRDCLNPVVLHEVPLAVDRKMGRLGAGCNGTARRVAANRNKSEAGATLATQCPGSLSLRAVTACQAHHLGSAGSRPGAVPLAEDGSWLG